MSDFTKQPREVLDYDITLADWLKEGDVIASAAMVDDDGKCTVDLVEKINSNKTLRIWISGGTDANTTKQSVLITTTAGRKLEVEFTIKIKDA